MLTTKALPGTMKPPMSSPMTFNVIELPVTAVVMPTGRMRMRTTPDVTRSNYGKCWINGEV
jgi:hypothetical protein